MPIYRVILRIGYNVYNIPLCSRLSVNYIITYEAKESEQILKHSNKVPPILMLKAIVLNPFGVCI